MPYDIGWFFRTSSSDFHLLFSDHDGMLEQRSFEKTDLRIPGAYVRRLQYNHSESIHGIIKVRVTNQQQEENQLCYSKGMIEWINSVTDQMNLISNSLLHKLYSPIKWNAKDKKIFLRILIL